MMFFAFDLLHQDGLDVLGLPLSERKRDLDRLCRKARVLPFLSQVETYPDAEVLLDYCNRFGFEGRREQATELPLRQRAEPPLAQGQVSGLEA